MKFHLSEMHYAGQYLIPAFDIQNATMDNPLPLTGIRLENYTSKGNASEQFLVPRLLTIDLAESLDIEPAQVA